MVGDVRFPGLTLAKRSPPCGGSRPVAAAALLKALTTNTISLIYYFPRLVPHLLPCLCNFGVADTLPN